MMSICDVCQRPDGGHEPWCPAKPLRALIGVVCLLAGCTTLPADPANMSPEQLKEYAKDKNASISCVQARNMSGTVAMITVNLDKSTFVNGSVTVKPASDCEATITATGKTPP
jgi:starvation-inducible outer membrane lipoprotein